MRRKSALILDFNITTGDIEDENEAFGVLEEDNESYLAEITVSSLSEVRADFSQKGNSTRGRKSEAKTAANDSFNSRRSYDPNRRNLAKTVSGDPLFDFRNNFYDLHARVESRYCKHENEAQSGENFALKHEAAIIIQKYWRRYEFRQIFKRIRDMLIKYSGSSSSALLRAVNPREADLMDRASGTFIRFRLKGENFPPVIVYKIFTNRPVVDLCKNDCSFYVCNNSGKNCSKNFHKAESPAAEGNKFAGKFVSGKGKLKNFYEQRYERADGNDWRPFLGSLVAKTEIFDVAAVNKDAISTRAIRKRRSKLELIKRLYENGRQEERERETEAARRN